MGFPVLEHLKYNNVALTIYQELNKLKDQQRQL